MVACNMRFFWAINKIKDLLKNNVIGRVIFARIETGQYLPDWHPWEDYRQMYSAKRNLGGGVVLDAIHEIDYAVWFFGSVEKNIAMYGKLSNLDIETEDTAEIMLKFKNGPMVNIHMDYVQRSPSRSCKIIGEKGTISWDINDNSIKLCLAKSKRGKIFNGPKNYNINQMYLDEIKHFLICVKNNRETIQDVTQGLGILRVALQAKLTGIRV